MEKSNLNTKIKIDGWLLIFFGSILISGIGSILSIVIYGLEVMANVPEHSILPFDLGRSVVNIISVSTILYFGFIKRKRLTIKLIFVDLWIINLLVPLTVIILLSGLDSVDLRILISVFFSTLWTAYFIKSERVRLILNK